MQTLSCNLTSKILLNDFAGFLGSRISISLLDLGHKVVVTDDMFIGREENISGPINWPKLRHDRWSKNGKPLQLNSRFAEKKNLLGRRPRL